MNRRRIGNSSGSSRSTSHRPASEKYYDCLQCAEQCRHTSPSGIVIGSSSKKNCSKNNNNSRRSLNKNTSAKTGSSGGKGKKRTGSGRRVDGEPASATKSLVVSKNTRSPSTARCFRIDEFCKRKKNGRNSGKNSNKQTKIVSSASVHLTPARKRSSLARPVRVHDAFPQPRQLMGADQRSIDVRCVQRQPNSQDSGNTGCDEALEECIDDDNAWPIRLRLEEMLELSLSRGRKNRRMRTRKRNKMMLASMFGHFKDTERLLKVLNNVDQDNRYNVKRCSVM